jgi:hypothetical protein
LGDFLPIGLLWGEDCDFSKYDVAPKWQHFWLLSTCGIFFHYDLKYKFQNMVCYRDLNIFKVA